MAYFTYIVECSDHTYYTGWTTDIDNRIKTHNSGKGSKYTRARLPVKLVYLKNHRDKHYAMHDEARIKKLTRAEKEDLIQRYQERKLAKSEEGIQST